MVHSPLSLSLYLFPLHLIMFAISLRIKMLHKRRKGGGFNGREQRKNATSISGIKINVFLLNYPIRYTFTSA